MSDFVINENNVLVQYNGSGGHVIIPEGVTEIGNGVFSGYAELVSVTIPEGVTKIGASAFDGCPELVAVFLPDSLSEIQQCAFFFCKCLFFITTLQERERIITTIKETDYERPENIEKIKKLIPQLPLPANLKTFGGRAFRKTPWLEWMRNDYGLVIINRILVDGWDCSEMLSGNCKPKGFDEIATMAFADAKLNSIAIDDDVIIHPGAFGILDNEISSHIKVYYNYGRGPAAKPYRKHAKPNIEDLYALVRKKNGIN